MLSDILLSIMTLNEVHKIKLLFGLLLKKIFGQNFLWYQISEEMEPVTVLHRECYMDSNNKVMECTKL